MSTSEFHGTKLSATAGGAIAAYRFVKHHSTSAAEAEIVEASGAGNRPIGISVDAAATATAGTPKDVGYVTDGYGRLEVTATTGLDAGTALKSGANGVGVAATSGDEYFAILRDPVPDDETRIVRVLIQRGAVPA